MRYETSASAMSVALASRERLLLHVHLNDNDRVAAMDLMTGTVHFWEPPECLLQPGRSGCSGWLATDCLLRRLDPWSLDRAHALGLGAVLIADTPWPEDEGRMIDIEAQQAEVSVENTVRYLQYDYQQLRGA